MKRCDNCNGESHIVAFEGIRTETKCEVCNGRGYVKSEEKK